MQEVERDKALKNSIIDGAFATIGATLAGGIFLVGFALQVLDAAAWQIGILAALPTFANLFQLLGSYLIEKTGRRKRLCLICATAARALWVFVILLPLAMFDPLADHRVWVLVAVILLSSLLNSLAGVGWLAWMSDVVPEKIRGTYFGKRNMIALACGTVAILAAGRFLTGWQERFGEGDPRGFMILFSVGLCAGLVSSFFLSRIMEPPFKRGGERLSLNLFGAPFRNTNFRNLIVFVSGWIFAIQLAGPFYGVYMIDVLEIEFSQITIYITLATVATLVMMKVWGPISDRVGNKPVILLSGWVLIAVPFLWLGAVPGNYHVPLVLSHLLTGGFIAGASLSQFNILLKLAPSEGRSIFLAVFAAVTGLVGAVAPVVGGLLVEALAAVSFNLGPFTVTNLHAVFLLSSVGQILVIFLILRVHEEGAAGQAAVIMELRNDLDPQKGVGASADFMLLGFQRTGGIIRKVDTMTEEMAERSEQRAGRLLSALERQTKRTRALLRRFLNKD